MMRGQLRQFSPAMLLVISCFLGSAFSIDTSSWVGAEYQPARSSNQDWLYHWDSYKEEVAREIPMIKQALSFTAFRVFLHSAIYFASPERLMSTMDEFLEICQRSGIRVGFVFFDDCWSHEGLDLQKPCQPTKGLHNHCWMASPQDAERLNGVDHFKPYVQEVVRRFQGDSRVLWWEIFNEPHVTDPYPQGNFSEALRAAAFGWAKALSEKPVISCWNEADDTARGINTSNAYTELNDAHQYAQPWNGISNAVFKNDTGKMKGGLVTEAGARWYQGTNSDAGSPLTLVDWLTKLRKNPAAKFVPGVMIDWEVMVSNSNTRWHWGGQAQDQEPAIPWHQHLFPDGSPVSYTEAAAIRRYITGKDEFLYFNDFLNHVPNPGSAERFLRLDAPFRPELTLKDGLVEMALWPDTAATVRLKLRHSAEDSYEIALDADKKTLSLSRGGKVRASFNVSSLDCGLLSGGMKELKGAWNLLRALVDGNRVQVWLNPMYPDVFPETLPVPSGPRVPIRAMPPRIDFEDPEPLKEGGLEVTAEGGGFLDYFSVLPPVLYGSDWPGRGVLYS
ncbi:unnamed protein product [Effrenium voratum]|nr:unnamed protein product [Effrenium voratum]